jgi:hypothetical protein
MINGGHRGTKWGKVGKKFLVWASWVNMRLGWVSGNVRDKRVMYSPISDACLLFTESIRSLGLLYTTVLAHC